MDDFFFKMDDTTPLIMFSVKISLSETLLGPD